ncbi:hypothetical protein [Nocardioides sambongensis]|uniref:hypothetical protein n=1 Tax=Nocardioides sambongensis TaxID=2589074 RepID=UPI001127DFF2|nr:hypothetical protein [Nocardioides sambongensis]
MTTWSYALILVLAGATAVLLLVDLIRDRSTQDSHYLALAVIEVAVLLQLVAGCVALARTERDVEGAVFISYLVTVALAPVAGALFSLAERSRVGTTVLLLAVATVAGMEVRLWDIWSGSHG